MSVQKAIDVSSHQPTNLTTLIHQHGPSHVIVKLYMPWESVSFNHSAQQITSARANGCTVGGYVWAYRSADPLATIDQVIARCASVDLVLPLLWIDCETYTDKDGTILDEGPNADWLAKAVEHAENNYDMPCGVYTGLWWINDHFPGGQAEFANFARLPIWLSDYDNDPNINAVELPQGWTEAAAKQYTDKPIDMSSIRDQYTVYEEIDPWKQKYDALKSGIQALLEKP